MTREEKGILIENLTEKLKNTPYFYIADTSGMTVSQINDFRRICFKKGLEYRIVKNTLIKKALQNLDTDYSPFDESVLRGTSGILFSAEIGNAPAKAIKEYRKKDKNLTKPSLKGASIDTSLYIGEEYLDTLSELKSKDELLGEIVSLLQSPAKNVISALQSGKHKLAGIIKTLSEKEEK